MGIQAANFGLDKIHLGLFGQPVQIDSDLIALINARDVGGNHAGIHCRTAFADERNHSSRSFVGLHRPSSEQQHMAVPATGQNEVIRSQGLLR